MKFSNGLGDPTMKKSYRVKREKDFQLVFRQGHSTANRQFVIYVYPKAQQKHFRVGLSVGKKLGNAVKRNFIKRRIRQSLFELKAHLSPEVDFIIIARKPVAQMSFHDIKKSLVHVLKLSRLLPKEFEIE